MLSDPSGAPNPNRAPNLRVAIWEDGRIVFARDPTKWSHDLREGRISADRVSRLKKAIEETGVFDLKGYCYLVPDAPMDCLMLAYGGKQQMLYWDEIEAPHYGINVDPKPHRRKFMACWKAVNRLALAACPDRSRPAKERFDKAPRSWFLKLDFGHQAAAKNA